MLTPIPKGFRKLAGGKSGAATRLSLHCHLVLSTEERCAYIDTACVPRPQFSMAIFQ